MHVHWGSILECMRRVPNRAFAIQHFPMQYGCMCGCNVSDRATIIETKGSCKQGRKLYVYGVQTASSGVFLLVCTKVEVPIDA